jgi:hypothetical protein
MDKGAQICRYLFCQRCYWYLLEVIDKRFIEPRGKLSITQRKSPTFTPSAYRTIIVIITHPDIIINIYNIYIFAENIELVGHVGMSIISWNPPNKQYLCNVIYIYIICDERRWSILEIRFQTRETKLTYR